MKRLIIMLGVGVALFAPQARADSDALIEGAKLCTAHLPRYEREYGIPTHLLSAIATTESGRYHEGLKLNIPWPWTVNAEGKGYVFESKAQAIAAVKRLRAQGIESIDVGCMQVNIYHHPDAFASLDQAFEPQRNIAYAAGFLRDLYDEEGSWKKAAADYHSRTPQRGREYVSKVYNSWFQIIDKLRAARLQVPESSVQAMNELKSSIRPAMVKTHNPNVQANIKLAAYHPLRMNDIHAKQADANESDVIVVKPEIKLADPAPIAAAGTTAYTPKVTVDQAMQVPLTLEDAAPAAGGQDSHLLHIEEQPVAETSIASQRKTGPNFIFND